MKNPIRYKRKIIFAGIPPPHVTWLLNNETLASKYSSEKNNEDGSVRQQCIHVPFLELQKHVSYSNFGREQAGS